MKRLFALSILVMTLAACSGSSSNNGNKPKGGTGGGNLPAPTAYNGERTLFTNKWRLNYEGGVMLFSFTEDSMSATNYCENGLTASVSARAINTETQIQVLEADSAKSGSGDTYCTADLAKGIMPYTITADGKLSSDGQTLDPY